MHFVFPSGHGHFEGELTHGPLLQSQIYPAHNEPSFVLLDPIEYIGLNCLLLIVPKCDVEASESDWLSAVFSDLKKENGSKE